MFNIAAVLHFEFAKFWYFVKPTLEAQSASTYQISLKSDDVRLRYSDKTIFKMAAVRHLEFSKFGILVMWPVLGSPPCWICCDVIILHPGTRHDVLTLC